MLYTGALHKLGDYDGCIAEYGMKFGEVWEKSQPTASSCRSNTLYISVSSELEPQSMQRSYHF